MLQTFNQKLSRWFKKADRLDDLAKPVQKGIQNLFQRGGSGGQTAADFLNGVWLGHPLHPLLTDIPLGAWTTTVTLDLLEQSTGKRGMAQAADAAAALGVAGALGSAVSGLADWQHTSGESRRVGVVHGVLNTLALAMFGLSLVARKQRSRTAGRNLALAGFSLAAAAAYLGGDLVYRLKIGVNHAPEELDVPQYQAVLPLEQLPERQLTRAALDETPLVLWRQGEAVYALAAACAHLGAPLEEGQVENTSDGQPVIICPWHASQFELNSGAVRHGPAAFAQPCFQARIREGQVEVRYPEPA